MSTEHNKGLVRWYLDHVVGGGDARVAEQLVAPGLVFTSPYTPEPARGRPAFLQMTLARK
jgi:hypothetical protein